MFFFKLYNKLKNHIYKVNMTAKQVTINDAKQMTIAFNCQPATHKQTNTNL